MKWFTDRAGSASQLRHSTLLVTSIMTTTSTSHGHNDVEVYNPDGGTPETPLGSVGGGEDNTLALHGGEGDVEGDGDAGGDADVHGEVVVVCFRPRGVPVHLPGHQEPDHRHRRQRDCAGGEGTERRPGGWEFWRGCWD